MWQDRGLNPGPLTYESGALLTGLCGLVPMMYPCRSGLNPFIPKESAQGIFQHSFTSCAFENGVMVTII